MRIAGLGLALAASVLACRGDQPHCWLSLNFTAGRLAEIYYLPGDPIQFVGPDN